MARLPTVKIQNPEVAGEYIIINEADFLPDVHTLWGEAPPQEAPPQEAPPQEAPPQEAPPEGEARVAAIVDAVRQVVESGDGLTQAGIPKVEAVEAVLGYDISADERNAAWAAYQEAQAGE